MAGAVVVVESEETPGRGVAPRLRLNKQRSLSRVEILGRSVLDRTVDNLRSSGLAPVSIVDIRGGLFETGHVRDPWHHVTQALVAMKEQRIDAVLIMTLGPYIEFSPEEMIRFRRQECAPVIQAGGRNGDLPVWVVALDQFPMGLELKDYLHDAKSVLFPLGGYVNRLESSRDLHVLAADGLNTRCSLRPAGFEVKPGIWMAQGAQVERGARIVAPAFVGRGAKIADQCLITRCSNVESSSEIDYGTVVEASSVLPDTYVGIGLDLSHCVVDGCHLEDLRREIALEISDAAILRRVPESKSRSRDGHSFSGIGSNASVLSLVQWNKQ